MDLGTTRASPAVPLLSIIVPVYNEVEAIKPFFEATLAVRDSLDVRTEIIVVNDGSSDGSLETLQCYVNTDSRYQPLSQLRQRGVVDSRSRSWSW